MFLLCPSNSSYSQIMDAEILDLLGPTIQHLTPLSGDRQEYCVLRGTVPPGIVVPLHSHPDRETFYILAGQLEAFKDGGGWRTLRTGDVFDVPGGAKHAFRNGSSAVASSLVVTTAALARFFHEVGRPIEAVPPGPPSRDALQRFAETSLSHGHWLGASPITPPSGLRCSRSTDRSRVTVAKRPGTR
jgi:quercetin dioxygenase-like cupin family protein